MEILPFYYNRTYYAINIGDIIYLESNRRVITAVCVSGIFEFYDKLENLEKYLEEHQQHFVRIHKSYLVNTSHIRELRYSEVMGWSLPSAETIRNMSGNIIWTGSGEQAFEFYSVAGI